MPVPSSGKQVFFHVTRVIGLAPGHGNGKRDIGQLLALGDGVEFALEESPHEPGRVQAVDVEKLPEGTVKREVVDQRRRRGSVHCFLGGDMYILPMPEDTLMEGLSEPLGKLKFSVRSNVRSGSHAPAPGDVVEFSVVVDAASASIRATDIEVVATAPTELDLAGAVLGRVAALSADGGEVEALDGSHLPFEGGGGGTLSDLTKLTIGCEVAFRERERGTSDEAARKAVAVQLLPPGTINAQKRIGIVRGTIAAMPTGVGGARTGRVTYSQDGSERSAAFGLRDVAEFSESLATGDQVGFELVRHKLTAEPSVANIKLLVRGSQAAELGRVSVLKKNFGFIRCCERVTDMFFHMSAVKEGTPEPALGDDVRFVPELDAASGKVHASGVEVVPSGTAVFEVTGARVYEGAVRLAAQPARGEAAVSKGVIVADVDGIVETLPFSPDAVSGPLPCLHAKVSFRVAEDRRLAGAAKRSVRTGVRSRAGRSAVDVRLLALAAPDPAPVPASVGADATRVPAAPGPRPAASSAPASPRPADVASAAAGPGAECRRGVAAGRSEACTSPAASAGHGANAARHHGTVRRILRSKRLPSGAALGVVRSDAVGGWSSSKRTDGTSAAADAAALALLEAKGLQCPLVHGDHLFWLADVREEHRAGLQKQDDVTYSLQLRTLDCDGEELLCEMAVDVARVRAARAPNTGARWQPPPPPPPPPADAAPPRRVPRFAGAAVIVVPGPAKGAVGFQAGRGRAVSELRARVSAFRLEETITASAFIPSSASVESFRTCDSACEPAAAAGGECAAATGGQGRFDDAD